MKKIRLLTGLSTLSILGLSTLPLTSCNNVKFTVHFNTNGGSEIADIKVNKDSTITKPADPIKKGCVFVAGFSDQELTKEFDFATRVTSDLTLYAKWEELGNLTQEEFMTLYTSYYNTFINSTFEYTKDDIVVYGNSEIEEITNVRYNSSHTECGIDHTSTSSVIAGNITPEDLKTLLDAVANKAFYKSNSNDDILFGIKDYFGNEDYMSLNKFGYDVFSYHKDVQGNDFMMYLTYKKDPTK